MNDRDEFCAGQMVVMRFPHMDAVASAIEAFCGKGPYCVLFVYSKKDRPSVAWIAPHDTDPKVVARFIPSEWDYETTKSLLISVVPTSHLRPVLN